MDQTNLASQPNLAPLALRVITLFGLMGAGLGILGGAAGYLLVSFGTANVNLLMVIIVLAKYILLFVALLALRKMKKWAFYLFGASAVASIIFLAVDYSQGQLVEVIVDVIFFAYLWTLRNRFV